MRLFMLDYQSNKTNSGLGDRSYKRMQENHPANGHTVPYQVPIYSMYPNSRTAKQQNSCSKATSVTVMSKSSPTSTPADRGAIIRSNLSSPKVPSLHLYSKVEGDPQVALQSILLTLLLSPSNSAFESLSHRTISPCWYDDLLRQRPF